MIFIITNTNNFDEWRTGLLVLMYYQHRMFATCGIREKIFVFKIFRLVSRFSLLFSFYWKIFLLISQTPQLDIRFSFVFTKMRRSRSSSPSSVDRHFISSNLVLPPPHEIHYYMRRTSPAVGMKQFEKEIPETGLEGAVDTIPHWNVACLLLDDLCTQLWKTPHLKALYRGVSYLASDTHKKAQNIKTFDKGSAAHLEALKKKHIEGREHPPSLTRRVAHAFRVLKQKSKLFSNLEALYQDWRKSFESLPPEERQKMMQKDFCWSFVGGFFIVKSSGKLRVITDARWANAYFDRSCLSFSLFAFATLRQVLDNLSIGGWYVANLDLRHWFHQIPLARRYMRYFGIRMTDNNNVEGEYVLLPNAAPMGWVASPFGAQSITWSLVLLREDTGKPNYIDWSKVSSLTAPFSWLPFTTGGGIFVILDNVLIVSSNKDIRDYYLNNLLNNCKKYDARLKTSIPDSDKPPPFEEVADKVREECTFDMLNDESKPFNFHGVDWYHNYHVVRTKDGEDKRLPNLPGQTNITSETGPWKGTRRRLSSILGLLNWYRTVHGIKNFDNPERYESFSTLYRALQPEDSDRKDAWDEEITISDRKVLAHLIELWRERGREEKCLAKPLFFRPSAVVHAATDAATNEKKNAQGQTDAMPLTASILFNSEGPEEVTVEPFDERHQHIALGELEAALLAVTNAVRRGQQLLIVLATDSMVTKHWLDSGIAHSKEALILLQKIDMLLTSSNSRLYTVYVNTNDNLADIPSRLGKEGYAKCQDGETARKRLATKAILRNAEAEARKTFLASGGRIGGSSVENKI